MGRAPANLSQHRFVRAVAGALRDRCGVGDGTRLLVAVSGGADSVALLRAMALLAPRRTWRLALMVGHVQHHLRPQEQAEGDAAFVAELASRLDLPLARADLTPPPGGGNVEAWARRSRYAALAEMARAFDASAVVVAHHADDQLETLLMRLLRGSSLRGLAGMAWRRRLDMAQATGATVGEGEPASPLLLLRPMLAADRAGVEAFLRDLGQPWREDHTNQDTSRTRARLRQGVTPVLRELRPEAAARAVALSDHWREVARLMEREASRARGLMPWLEGRATLARADARRLPRVVLAGLLRGRLIEAGASGDALGSRQVGPVVRAARDRQGGRRAFAFGGGARAVVTRESVEVTGEA